MPVYANFFPATPHLGVPLVRTDTKLYLSPPTTPTASHVCVGTVYLHNPGSASPIAGGLISRDPTLRIIEQIFATAMRTRTPKRTYTDPFLEILNLCYYATPSPPAAKTAFQRFGPTTFQSIAKSSQFVWVAWGGQPEFQGPLIPAILDIDKSKKQTFCFDGGSGRVVDWTSAVLFPAHPLSHRKYLNYVADIATRMALHL